jgi:hypothetical protein
MGAKHTPGPWRADRVLVENTDDHMIVHVATWGGENIADCGTFAECNPADARLIAAAPDMYGALVALVPLLAAVRDAECTVYVDDAADAIDAALARAEGR